MSTQPKLAHAPRSLLDGAIARRALYDAFGKLDPRQAQVANQRRGLLFDDLDAARRGPRIEPPGVAGLHGEPEILLDSESWK